MSAEFSVKYAGDYVHVTADGNKDFDFSTRLWTEVVRVCRENQCFRVLGISNSTLPLDITEANAHPDLFATLGVGRTWQIAWVENSRDAFDFVKVAEIAIQSRGFNVRLFTDEAGAREWLFS